MTGHAYRTAIRTACLPNSNPANEALFLFCDFFSRFMLFYDINNYEVMVLLLRIRGKTVKSAIETV